MNKFNRAAIVDQNFVNAVEAWSRDHHAFASARRDGVPAEKDRAVVYPNRMTGKEMIEIFEAQVLSRHLDLIARELRKRDASFYTIGSSGHEGNAVVGHLTRTTDPAFLHYRSGGFVMRRSLQDPTVDPIYDSILSQAASSEDPISGGRHKVWGSKKLWVIPQTSTIASHLPKAVGAAISIGRAKKIGFEPPVPRDSIMVCSFGDASSNHSTALGAFNTAAWASYQRVPVPVLFVCEDNGLGISVKSPPGYIEQTYSNRPGLAYYRCNGLDMIDTYEIASRAIEHCRSRRSPVFLHMKVVRLLGHAGSDFELEYRSEDEVIHTESQDPLLASAQLLIEHGLMTAEEIHALYEDTRRRCREAGERAIERPRLETAEEVMKPLAPFTPAKVEEEAVRNNYGERRLRAFGSESRFPENTPPRHMAAQINSTLFDLLAKYPESLLFGEDVARKGGVYHVTAGLEKAFRAGRVFNSLLDEQAILGLAQGAGYMNLLPIAEIQYLAYFHNACDQIRGEACSLQFFSNDQFRNPMVVRVASLGYQKGFGGHFHNDNSTTALRDIPGLVIACPSRGDDASAMLRSCTALAKVDGRVVFFLEPIALYMTKDLYEDQDAGWSFPIPPLDTYIAPGTGRVYHENAEDLLIITYGNGVYFSLRAARELAQKTGASARVFDLRWLAPLDLEGIARNAKECGRVLIVDEGRKTGSVSEAIFSHLHEAGLGSLHTERVTGEDSYIPLGPAANTVLPTEAEILERAKIMVRDRVATS